MFSQCNPSDPANRLDVFSKGTSRVCVGPNAGIGLRADSKFTAPEPELAVVLGSVANRPRSGLITVLSSGARSFRCGVSATG
jgi:hypothetical protein